MPFTCPPGCPADCCYFTRPEESPLVFEDEKRRLEEEARKRGVELTFEEAGSANGTRIYRWVIRGWCPFFDRRSRRCTIHDRKPLACRMFPLILRRDGAVEVSQACVWVRLNKPSSIEEFPAELEAVKRAAIRLGWIR